MNAVAVLHGVVGAILLFGSIGSAIYIVTNGKEVKTWVPFGWSGVLGFIILSGVAFQSHGAGVAGEVIRVEPFASMVNIAGALLLLGCLVYSMYLSASARKEPSSWAPLVWGVVVGLLAM